MDIPGVIEAVLAQHHVAPVVSLQDVLEADEWARRCALKAVSQAVGEYA
jgi:1-deoxy-D-xylulose 5-phosphate reductoisomerase